MTLNQRLRAAVQRFRRAPAQLERSAPLWDAGRQQKRNTGWISAGRSPNSFSDNPALLRGRGEDAYRNNPYARKGVDSIVNAAVGATGLNPMFRDLGSQASWDDWGRAVDLEGRFDWSVLLCEALRCIAVSGEVFVLLVVDPAAGGVPLRLQLLGPEYLDTSRVDHNTYGGIRYDGIRRTGYWLFQRNPAVTYATLQSVFVPAERCLHIYRAIAPGAQRGQTWYAPVLIALRELNEYLEASLTRAKTGALFCGFVRTPDGTNPLAPVEGTPTLEPGAMVRLRPQEEVEFAEPPDAGITLDPFVRAQLRLVASGLGLPYEILSGDYSNVTFASGRHGLLEFRRTVEAIQYGLLVPQLCMPVMRYWARLAGAIEGREIDTSGVRWIGPTIEMLDPRMETLATINRVRAGFMSRSEAVAQLGWRAEDVDAEIARDNARADRLGLVLDSDPRRVTQQGQEQQQQKEATVD